MIIFTSFPIGAHRRSFQPEEVATVEYSHREPSATGLKRPRRGEKSGARGANQTKNRTSVTERGSRFSIERKRDRANALREQ